MRVVGRISTALLAVGVIAAVAVTVVSIPDIKRYLRMRQM
ncbi:DUF6893 family small protein [Rhodococcus sp. NPDC059234]